MTEPIQNHYPDLNVEISADTSMIMSKKRHVFQPKSREELLTNLAKANEARKTAPPKAVFVRAIHAHCAACWPYRTDCQAQDSCQLYQVRNPEARRGKRKKDLRRAIRENCRECVGTNEDICSSPKCALHAFRLGRKATVI
jgi:hypothetical protein